MPLHLEHPVLTGLVAALLLLGVVVATAALTTPAYAWLDRQKQGVTATHSRVSSSVQAVVTTAAFTIAYATYPGNLPDLGIWAGIAVLFGLALGGEIQAERLHRRALAHRR